MLFLAALACLPAAAREPKSLALLDFEVIDEMRAFATEEARRETDRRAALISAELARELERRGMYRVLDHAPAAKLIERLKASTELRACNGCELDIASALGAERGALCWVQKVSNLIRHPRQRRRVVAACAAWSTTCRSTGITCAEMRSRPAAAPRCAGRRSCSCRPS